MVRTPEYGKAAEVVILSAVLLVLCPGAAVGQIGIGPELEGLDRFALGVVVTWDAEIPSSMASQAKYEQQVRDAFELPLLRAGIELENVSGYNVTCSVGLKYAPSVGVVSYVASVYYDEIVQRFDRSEDASVDGPVQAAIVWMRSSVGHVGVANLDGRDEGARCADAFLDDWRLFNTG